MDTKSRPSWKTISKRMRRTAESCQARWQWLKNTNSPLLNPLLMILLPMMTEWFHLSFHYLIFPTSSPRKICFVPALVNFGLLRFVFRLVSTFNCFVDRSYMFCGSKSSFSSSMSTHPPRSDASRSRSPLHGPAPFNPPLTMGSIESSEFFTRWRPVIVMAQFHDLAFIEEARHLGGLMNICRERNVPNLHRH